MRAAIVDRLLAHPFDDDDNEEEEVAIIAAHRAKERLTVMPLDPPEPA